MTIRDHDPIVVENFNGFFNRGGADSCPPDHFPKCNNIRYIESGFASRDGIEPHLPIPEVVRMYTYTKQTGEALLMLDKFGDIYDSDYPTIPIYHFDGMTDFAFIAYNGRAYISPTDGYTGLDWALQVYLGDGTPARAAAGHRPRDPEGALTGSNTGTGDVEAGIHIFGVVYQTNTGFLTQIGPDSLAVVTAPGGQSVHLANIPISTESFVTGRQIVATKLIQASDYTGDPRGYQFFFVPEGAINDNTTTDLDVSFFDSELLQDASYLLDVYELIPAPVGLGFYHNRMISYGEHDNPSVCRVSAPGEPEVFDTVDGLLIFPLDGKPITNGQEFRDILYLFKSTKTYSWSDNGDVPASWPMSIIDQGIGTSVHGIFTVLDSGGVNIEYLIICSFSGIFLFTGLYVQPELSWKIFDFWKIYHTSPDFKKIQAVNETINKILYLVLPDGTMLMGDYSNGLDRQVIRWTPWTFTPKIRTLALLNGDTLVLGATSS